MHAIRVAVDHHVRNALALELVGNHTANAPVAADDEVVLELLKHAVEPARF